MTESDILLLKQIRLILYEFLYKDGCGLDEKADEILQLFKSIKG